MKAKGPRLQKIIGIGATGTATDSGDVGTIAQAGVQAGLVASDISYPILTISRAVTTPARATESRIFSILRRLR